MLKSSSNEEKLDFVGHLFMLINPKYQSEEEFKAAKIIALDFARTCEITADEMIHAIELAIDGKLMTVPDTNGNSDKIKLYREIDRIKLGEIKSAYIHHKRTDKSFENGLKMIENYNSPKPKELTEEEKIKQRNELRQSIYDEIKAKGNSERAFLIYDEFKEKINLSSAKRIEISNKWLSVLINKEITKSLFLNKQELKDLQTKMRNNEPIDYPEWVKMSSRNEVVVKHIKENGN